MAITKIDTNQLRLSKPTGIVFFPYVRNGVLRGEGFDIHDIVGDTYSGTQDDPDETEIPHEFSDSPLDLSVTLGTETITMQCLDFQDNILKELYGWDTTTASGFAVAPAQYKDLNCLVILQFGTQGVNVVMPNVKMNSKSLLENLRSDIARGELGGTLLSASVTLDDNPTPVETPKMFVKNGHSITIGDVVITIAADGTLTINGGSISTVIATENINVGGTTNGSVDISSASISSGATVTTSEGATWVEVTSATYSSLGIKVSANLSGAERTAYITVKADGEEVGVVKIIQAAE